MTPNTRSGTFHLCDQGQLNLSKLLLLPLEREATSMIYVTNSKEHRSCVYQSVLHLTQIIFIYIFIALFLITSYQK